MSDIFPENTDDWIQEKGPRTDVVISSRARLARNLPRFPFAPRARKEQLAEIAGTIHEAIQKQPRLEDFSRFELADLSPTHRRFLRESHLISSEMEKGQSHREVYLSREANTSIMVNEEDHIRMHTIRAGLRIEDVYRHIESLEEMLEGDLNFAYSPYFGYLTACPTNTGTGLRVSVMVHLVALVMTNQIEEALSGLGGQGLTVRGAYGEHSSHAGDLFQISNEVTLGKTEEELVDRLKEAVNDVIERETEAREHLVVRAAIQCEDAVERAIGLLSHARSIDTTESIEKLSHLRLGLGRNDRIQLTHEELNRLMIEVQQAHILHKASNASSSDERDVARASFLRDRMEGGGLTNPN